MNPKIIAPVSEKKRFNITFRGLLITLLLLIKYQMLKIRFRVKKNDAYAMQ